MTISSLLVALIRIMCAALPRSSAKLVLDGKDLLTYFSDLERFQIFRFCTRIIPFTLSCSLNPEPSRWRWKIIEPYMSPFLVLVYKAESVKTQKLESSFVYYYFASALRVKISVLGCRWPGWKWMHLASWAHFFKFIASVLKNSQHFSHYGLFSLREFTSYLPLSVS